HLQWHKRPDWFGVVGTSRLYDGHDTRDSYVTWIEPVNPVIVVELLSQSTKKQDLGEIETEGKEIGLSRTYGENSGISDSFLENIFLSSFLCKEYRNDNLSLSP
ncbi:MAG: hypothetical protein F6K41_29400, partial [Symploca sp. SIO3E6]|nr:hypothetical protein [Caldora sp. SIO3E6]